MWVGAKAAVAKAVAMGAVVRAAARVAATAVGSVVAARAVAKVVARVVGARFSVSELRALVALGGGVSSGRQGTTPGRGARGSCCLFINH